MTYLDKNGILDRLPVNGVALELGCGNRKRIRDAIGIDALDYECVDIVGEVFEVLRLFPDKSVNAIHTYHFVEHISSLDELMTEFARVLMKGSKVHIVAPHFSNPYFYSDYTHKTFYGLYTFCYFTNDRLFKRDVPLYQRDIQFDLMSVDLIFKSTKPFYLTHAFKICLGKIFNLTTFSKELYEQNFCYIFPCYEISYQLQKI